MRRSFRRRWSNRLKRKRIKEMESLKGRCFRSSRDLSFVLDAENVATTVQEGGRERGEGRREQEKT